ncbi:hypothetical protein DN536_39245, partial [Burkholderia multivorans]
MRLAKGQVDHLSEDAVVLDDGTELPADLVVYATGYGSMNGWVADLDYSLQQSGTDFRLTPPDNGGGDDANSDAGADGADSDAGADGAAANADAGADGA